MYMVRHVWNCARGKAPEGLEAIKAVNSEFANEGNTSGKIYLDYSNRMDTIVWELEVESLDEYFTGQRGYYAGLTADTRSPIDDFNSNTVEGNREIYEVIV
jgi:hypothetical protein